MSQQLVIVDFLILPLELQNHILQSLSLKDLSQLYINIVKYDGYEDLKSNIKYYGELFNGRLNKGILKLAREGDIEGVQWLASQPGIDIRKEYILRVAALSKNLELVQWLASQTGVDITDKYILIGAILSNDLQLLQWLVSQPGVDITDPEVIEKLMKSNDVKIIEWFESL